MEEIASRRTGHGLSAGLRSLLKWSVVVIAICAISAGAWFGFDRYQHRFVRKNDDLVKLLPPGDLTTFFIDVAALRRAGFLHLLTGIRPAAEKDYADFVAQTGFDYGRDMDALAGAVDGDSLFFLIRGRFDWSKLRAFTTSHGGFCKDDGCRAPGITPHRWVSFIRVQPDTVGLATSNSQSAADLLRPPGGRLQEVPPRDPVWVTLSQALLRDPTVLPKPLRIFAISMHMARSVVLSAGQAAHANEAFIVQLEANFPNAASADTTCKQLQIQTRMLRLELAHENREPNPADLTGLLTGGTFQAGNTRVFGTWPVRKELLNALE